MIRNGISIFLLLLAVQAYGQSISRQVIGSTGKISSESNFITATVGPSILSTAEGDSTILTQGFQQPTTGMILTSVSVINANCYELNSGQIDLNITGCNGIYEIEWSTGDTTSVVENLVPGVYHYSIRAGLCELADSVEISISSECSDGIYNLVTPNGDGANDYLIIPRFHLESNQINEVTIYNRWGQEIWAGTNYDNTQVVWSGTNTKGKELPAGTYYYIVTHESELLSGFIELLR